MDIFSVPVSLNSAVIFLDISNRNEFSKIPLLCHRLVEIKNVLWAFLNCYITCIYDYQKRLEKFTKEVRYDLLEYVFKKKSMQTPYYAQVLTFIYYIFLLVYVE